MLDLTVLYEDNHLLVVDKPADLPTQPTPQSSDSLETAAKQWLKEKYHKPGAVFLHAVHRLDKPVRGIVLFAKTSKALSRLQKALKENSFHKEYVAFVENGSHLNTGTLEHYLIHGSYRAEVVDAEVPKAKKALLHYTVIRQEEERTRIRIVLETGRYHQIRAQFAAIGSPIVGDTKYGGCTWNEPGIALEHVRLEFPHPISGERVDIEMN